MTPGVVRIVSGMVSVVCFAMIALAFVLVPDPSGVGTHQQMMAPPCWLHLFTGLPCPFCGMTTAFAHLARGQVARAFACHCLGPAACVFVWAVGIVGLWGLVTGRSYPLRLLASYSAQKLLLAVVMGGWMVNLARVILRP
ncbi:MAG: DUF2752 domain-containing protein [Acidobacteriota bacterium]|nr:DUF2752 domain-containing protein [Acidobacteriota bacterium]